jgi:hypothetical protein
MGDLKVSRPRPTTLEYTRSRESILMDYSGTEHLMKCSQCWTLCNVVHVHDGSEPRTAIILCSLCELNRKLKTL